MFSSLDYAKKQSVPDHSITRWDRPRNLQLDLFIDLTAKDICRHICLDALLHSTTLYSLARIAFSIVCHRYQDSASRYILGKNKYL